MYPVSSTLSNLNHNTTQIGTLDAETKLLAYRLSGYASLKILQTIHTIPPLTTERVKQLCVNHSFSELFKGQSGITLFFTRNCLLPLLEKHLPNLLEKSLLNINNISSKEMTFPKKPVEGALQRFIDYSYELENAARLVTKEDILSGTMDHSIGEALAKFAHKSGNAEEILLPLGVQKLLSEIVTAEILSRTPWLLQTPVYLWLRVITWSMSFCFLPIYYLLKPYLPKGKGKPDPLIEELSIPFQAAVCDFLKKLEKAFEDERAHPSTSPAISIDLNLFNRVLQRQIAILPIGNCSSQHELERLFKDSFTKDLTGFIQDKFVIEEIRKSLDEFISVTWKVIASTALRKETMLSLYQQCNKVFSEPANPNIPRPSIETASREFSESSLRYSIGDVLNKTESFLSSLFKKTLSKCMSQNRTDRLKASLQKHLISKIYNHDTLLGKIVPLALKGQDIATEIVVNFWNKPYNRRYGIFHYQVLRPWVKTSLRNISL